MASLWPGLGGPGIDYISRPPSDAWCAAEKRSLCLLGSTGSIGGNALRIVDAHPDFFRVEALAGGRNAGRLAEQAARYRPSFLAVQDEATARELEKRLPAGCRPEILVGPDGYRTVASLGSVDTVLSAQAGSAGLRGTLAAALAGKTVCLANKESLVQAGDLVRHVCAKTGAAILPVDSEHYALFDLLAGRGQEAQALVITASGGPFRTWTAEEMTGITPAQALRHPNWTMGAKITVDSATLMNKALELMEACHLYGLSADRVRVLVHPQSIVHSLVVFKDGSQLAQMGVPDMRLPIGNCLLWPRAETSHVEPLYLGRVGTLTFEEVDAARFPSLDLARKAMEVRSGMAIVLNAADETAVDLFLAGRCSFGDIFALVEAAMERHLCVLRDRNAVKSVPFCLSEDMLSLEGKALEDACWQRVEAIEALSARASSFVRRQVEAGGNPQCSQP